MIAALTLRPGREGRAKQTLNSRLARKRTSSRRDRVSFFVSHCFATATRKMPPAPVAKDSERGKREAVSAKTRQTNTKPAFGA
jgi:hypothetical protein